MKQQKGFIAIITALIITFILVILIFTTGLSSFFARFDALDNEYKRKSLALAESCVNLALLKLGQNYDYAGGEWCHSLADSANVYCDATAGTDSDKCFIKPIEIITSDTNKKKVGIKASAHYPATNGSFTVSRVVATVSSPTASGAVSAPTCSLTPSEESIEAGDPFGVNWQINGIATEFNIVRLDKFTPSGAPFYSASPGPLTGFIADNPTSSSTYFGTVTGPGGTEYCFTQVLVIEGASVSCADTVVMLTGGMDVNSLDDQGAAAKALLDLYDNVTPHPLTGIGSYGGLDNSDALIPYPPTYNPDGQLKSTYLVNDVPGTGLYELVDQIVNTINPAWGTNLAEAIQKAQAELNSERHIKGHARVMVFVSDGKPNLPSPDEEIPLNAADDAKQDFCESCPGGVESNSIQIFGVHFHSSPSGRDLVAQIATGDTTNGSHQSGSLNQFGNSQNIDDINEENDDDDNFFIAPDAAGMAGVFEKIAETVCPAVAPEAPNPGGGGGGGGGGGSGITIDSWGECATESC